MPKGTFKQYLLYEMFTHEKAGFPQTNEESPPFFVYRIKSRFSVKRRNPNPSPTWKIKFGFLSFGPSGESRTHGLLNPILCDEWYGRTHRQKSAETSHFQCFLFPRFWYDTGSFITHSLRPPDGEIVQSYLIQATPWKVVRPASCNACKAKVSAPLLHKKQGGICEVGEGKISGYLWQARVSHLPSGVAPDFAKNQWVLVVSSPV